MNRAFFAFIRPYLNFRVGPIWIRGLGQAQAMLKANMPLVLYANHTSWYDAFLLRRVVQLLKPRHVLAFPMAEREYRRRPYARLVGAIPFAPSPQKTVSAFGGFRKLRRQHGADLAVVYFPQGRIDTGMVPDLVFQRGLEVLVRRLAPIQTLAVAIQFEMMQTPKPQVFLSLGKVTTEPSSTEKMNAQVEELRALTRRELDSLGEDFSTQHSESWQPCRW